MGSLLIIVVNLYIYIDSDVGNLRKSNIFTIILDTCVWHEIRFTSNLIFSRPFMKVEYIYTCEAILYFKQMGLNLTCQGMWVTRYRTILFAERGVIGAQIPGNFLFASIFLLG